MTMDASLKDKIIDRVKKCFALGNSAKNNNQHEAQAAMDAAEKLMRQYNLSMAEVQVDEETGKVKQEVKKDFTEAKKMKAWERYIGHVIECLLPVKFYLNNKYNENYRRVTSLCFIGLEDDAALAKEMYTIFRNEIMRMARIRGFESKTEKKSYCLGVVQTMLDRAVENKSKHKMNNNPQTEEEKIDSRCTALIVVKEKAVLDFYNQLDLRTSRSRRMNISGDAYGMGRQDGHKVNLNINRVALK